MKLRIFTNFIKVRTKILYQKILVVFTGLLVIYVYTIYSINILLVYSIMYQQTSIILTGFITIEIAGHPLWTALLFLHPYTILCLSDYSDFPSLSTVSSVIVIVSPRRLAISCNVSIVTPVYLIISSTGFPSESMASATFFSAFFSP